MKKKTGIIMWATEIYDLLEKKPIGGIAVQMYFWSQVFSKNGWSVYSFAKTAKKSFTRKEINFKPIKSIQHLNFLLEWWYAIKFLIMIRPAVVIYRGANRALLPLALFSRLFGVKLIFFSASDVNFEPGKELVGSKFNRKLYYKAIKHIRYFVVQNEHQHDTLLRNYNKDSLTIYNIWGEIGEKENEMPPRSDAVWVANFRRLKRAEWVLDTAETLPEYSFAMAGGKRGDKGYYDSMLSRAKQLPNMCFLGSKSFFYTNALIENSKILLCTSTFEGFPNTFLQAWSKGIPVISTVDPSGIISANKLGEIVKTEEELRIALQRMIKDEDYYQTLRNSINHFFATHHAAQIAYNNLMKYIRNEQS